MQSGAKEIEKGVTEAVKIRGKPEKRKAIGSFKLEELLEEEEEGEVLKMTKKR